MRKIIPYIIALNSLFFLENCNYNKTIQENNFKELDTAQMYLDTALMYSDSILQLQKETFYKDLEKKLTEK